MNNFLSGMDLPMNNPNEDLETVSERLFRALFDTDRFEVRPEKERDKGIDFHIELKNEGRYTNFRFAVQLKATDKTDVNADGSISLVLDTSNINYLLNSGHPAFYVLYVRPTNAFFYENINDFVRSLSEKNEAWGKQSTHTLRFQKRMEGNGVKAMYNTTLERGKMSRMISERLATKSAVTGGADKIQIDANMNVTDDVEIRRLIEGIGLVMINEARWAEVLILHRRASQSVATTAKYNLIVGIAYYYTGALLEALSFLKTAKKMQAGLTGEMREHLSYYDMAARFSLGLISGEDYHARMREIESHSGVGLYLQLEKAKENYIRNVEADADKGFQKLKQDFEAILKQPKATESLALHARTELLLLEGSKITMDNVRRIALVNTHEIQSGVNVSLRAQAVRDLLNAHASWGQRVELLKKEAAEAGNYFIYFNALLHEAKVKYEFIVTTTFVSIGQGRPGTNSAMPDYKPLLSGLNEYVLQAKDYYQKIGHVENTIVALGAYYEILHFLKQMNEAEATMKEIEALASDYELTAMTRRGKHLKNGGTTHEKWQQFFEDIERGMQAVQTEFEGLLKEMEDMDAKERIEKIPIRDTYTIDLFPIQLFRFPKNELENVFSILNIRGAHVKERFKQMFEIRMIPVANIYYVEIAEEGPRSGKQADTGIGSWRNIYRIRKAFYSHRYYRLEPPVHV